MTPAEVLSSAVDYEDFKEKILALRGDFPFDARDMLDLGRVYFIRYPDTSDSRNMYNISTGYRIVRLCVLEKVLLDIDKAHRPLIHDMLDDMTRIEPVLERLFGEVGAEGLDAYRSTVSRSLDRIKAVIDELPRCMIKERFIGGISKFYNEMYLVSSAIEQLKNRRGG